MFIIIYTFFCAGQISHFEGEGGVVTAWHLLERSHHSFWQLEYGNLTHSTAPWQEHCSETKRLNKLRKRTVHCIPANLKVHMGT